MMRRLLYQAALWLTVLLYASCLNKNDALPSEHKLSAQRAKEDFTKFMDILKKAHPALYAYTPEPVLNRYADSLKNSISGSISQRQLYNLLALVAARISCSHTSLYLPSKTVDALLNQQYFFPYPVVLIEGKLLVNVQGYSLPQGTEIMAINKMPAAEILRSLGVYNATDGLRPGLRQALATSDFGYQFFLKYGPQNVFEVDCIRPDSGAVQQRETILPVTLETLNSRYRDEKYYYDATDIDYDFYTRPEAGYAVMKIRTFEYDTYSKDQAFDNFCKNTFTLLQLSRGIHTLVIDIRENSGGNYSNCHLLFSYLAAGPFQEYQRVSTRVKQLPEDNLLQSDYGDVSGEEIRNLVDEEFYKATNGKYYLADSVNETMLPKPQRFNGNVLVMVNGEVNSAASYFASMVKNSGRGKIVGEETRGGAYMHNGFSSVVYRLPNSKIEFAFSVANVVQSYGQKEDYGRGVEPDYVKPSTLKDFTGNMDTQLNFIQDSLINN